MADGVIQLSPDSTGKMVDVETITVGSNTVYRERQRIAGLGAAELADVKNAAPSSTAYGLVTRPLLYDANGIPIIQKAASTAAVASDPALVVTPSPNGIFLVQGAQGGRSTGSIVAATTVVGPFTASNYNIATVTVSGTFGSVSFVFEGSDDGTNWYGLQGTRTDASVVENGPVLLTSTNRAWDVPIGALTNFRVRATAWSSGTAVIGVTMQTLPYDPAPAVGIANMTGAGTAKGTQGALALPVQNLVDSGRNHTNYFMVKPVVSTATDTLMSLTGYKSGAAVTATTTPAVVTAGKTYRIVSITMTYVAIATAGYVVFSLRVNLSGVGAVGSPLVQNWSIGGPGVTAGMTQTVSVPVPDGMEFPAGAGIVITMLGYGATATAAAVGYGMISIHGFEY